MSKPSLLNRAFTKIDKVESGCWIWTAAHNRQGYGIFDGRYAHRVLYKVLVGDVSDELHLDHLCRVRDCVNPAHLEPVSPRENNRRSESPTALNAIKTECKRGHQFTEANTYFTTSGYRNCRSCHADYERARRAIKRA